MSSTLTTECPHCWRRGRNNVIFTDPVHYRWNDASDVVLKRRTGHGLDHRTRTRQCAHCGQRFDTVEMWKGFLSALVAELSALESKVFVLELERDVNGTTIAELERKLCEIRAIVAPPADAIEPDDAETT